MLMLEAAFSEDLVNILNVDDFVSMFLEVSPDGVVFGGSGVDTDDFTNEGLPSVWPVVHSVVEGFVAMRIVRSVVTGADDLPGLVTTFGTDDSAVVCKDGGGFLAGTRHFMFYYIWFLSANT